MRFITLNSYNALQKAFKHLDSFPNTSKTELGRLFGINRSGRLLNDRQDFDTYIYEYDGRVYSLTDVEIAASDEYNSAEKITKREVIDKYGIRKTETLNSILRVRGFGTEAKNLKIYNRNLFDSIDTEEDAYWLGFITADGYVMETRGWLSIKLGLVDRGHLVKFLRYAGFAESEIESEIKIEKGGSGQDIVCAKLYTPQIVKNLVALGVRQGKSCKEEFYPVREDLIRHYIRGYFDGDGGFVNSSKRKVIDRAQIVGSEQFLNEVLRRLILDGIPLRNKVNNKTGDLYALFITSLENVYNFSNYLYKDSIINLDRKYKQYKEIKMP